MCVEEFPSAPPQQPGKRAKQGAVKKQKKRLHREKSNDAAFFVV